MSAETLHFFVPGKPRGQQRPRFVRKLGIAYTPKDSVNAMAVVRQAFVTRYPNHSPWDVPIGLSVHAHFDVPKSKPKWWREAAWEIEQAYASKPDVDNIAKLVQDALTGVAWRDDALISRVRVDKDYCWRRHAYVGIDVEIWTFPVLQKGEKP